MDSIQQQAEALIATSRSSFEGREWWNSELKRDVANRQHVETVWRDTLQFCDDLTDGIASVERILARLDVVGEEDRFVVGYSVGYKKPGPGEIQWANIKGAEDPIVASRKAAARDDVKTLLSKGYAEYGISPMIEWRPRQYRPETSTQANASAPRM